MCRDRRVEWENQILKCQETNELSTVGKPDVGRDLPLNRIP